MAEQRLQKIIAAAGISSRRKAEELITQGRVTVNGQIVTALGSKADLETDHIKVDGKLLQGAERHVYLLLNKPKGYVTTVSDPEGRPTVMDLVKGVEARIYPVGRLDWASEGLLLLTNDGELASKLTRAASHVQKTYLVKIAGRATEEGIEKLRRGIRIGAKPGPRAMKQVHTAPALIRMTKDADNPWYEVTLIEGKNRQIRRMFEEIGHHVEKIKRVRYGPLTLDVEPGQFRQLTLGEVAGLRRAGRGDKPPQRPSQKPAERAGFAAPERSEKFRRPEKSEKFRRPERFGRSEKFGSSEKFGKAERSNDRGHERTTGGRSGQDSGRESDHRVRARSAGSKDRSSFGKAGNDRGGERSGRSREAKNHSQNGKDRSKERNDRDRNNPNRNNQKRIRH